MRQTPDTILDLISDFAVSDLLNTLQPSSNSHMVTFTSDPKKQRREETSVRKRGRGAGITSVGYGIVRVLIMSGGVGEDDLEE